MYAANDTLFRHILYPKTGLETLPKAYLLDLHVAGARIMAEQVRILFQ